MASESSLALTNMPSTTEIVGEGNTAAEKALAFIMRGEERRQERESKLFEQQQQFLTTFSAELQIGKEERKNGHRIVRKLAADVSSISDQVASLKAQVDAGVSVQHSLYRSFFYDARCTAVSSCLVVCRILSCLCCCIVLFAECTSASSFFSWRITVACVVLCGRV